MDKFNETTVGRYMTDMFPGFVEKLPEDERLTKITFSGSIKNELVGLRSNRTKWTNHPLYDDLILAGDEGSKTRNFARVMAEQNALNLLRTPDGRIITTAPANNFFANSNRYISDFDAQAKGIGTAVNELECLSTIISSSSVEVIDWDQPWSTILGNNYTGVKKFLCRIKTPPDAAVMAARDMVSTLGYKYAEGAPIYCQNGVNGVGPDYVNRAVMDSIMTERVNSQGDGSSGSGWKGYSADGLMLALSLCTPGIKYIPYIIGSSPGADLGTWGPIHQRMYGQEIGTGGYQARHMWICIPVVDDGNENFFGVTVLAGKVKLFSLIDSRYKSYSGKRIAASYTAANINRFVGTEFTKADGTVVTVSSLPSSGWSSISSSIGISFLPLLVAPLPDQHYLISAYKSDIVEYLLDDGVSTVLVEEIVAEVTTAAYKIDKTWYNTYYTTGFGLYTPKNSNIQKNILDKWNQLDMSSLGVCIDNTYSTFGPNLVYQSDLARDYKKARERACKDNDWLNQVYSNGITYGQIRDRMLATPELNAIFSLTQSDATPAYDTASVKPSRTVVWTRTTDESNAVILTRVENDEEGAEISRETYPLNDTTRDILGIELSQGASYNGLSQMINDFGLTDKESNGLNDAIKASSNPYLVEQPALRGLVMETQYFTPLEALSNSGYPVIRYMPGVYAQALVLRNYFDLQTICSPFVKIIESFSGDKIVAKLRTSK